MGKATDFILLMLDKRNYGDLTLIESEKLFRYNTAPSTNGGVGGEVDVTGTLERTDERVKEDI